MLENVGANGTKSRAKFIVGIAKGQRYGLGHTSLHLRGSIGKNNN